MSISWSWLPTALCLPCAAERILALSHELPIRIGHRAVLVNRVGPDKAPEPIQRRLADLSVARLPDVPQDDRLEQAGAVGRDVFSLGAESAAVRAVYHVVQTLCAASPA